MRGRNGRFAGKVVLITGGSGGQGLVEGRMFSDEGAAVVLTDVVEAPGRKLAAQLRRAGRKAMFLSHDVTSAEQWAMVARAVKNEFGALHVLVNNAGVVARAGIREMRQADWQRILDINLTGPMLGIKACAPHIRRAGGGAIVNISSTAGILAHPSSAYTASKWGLRGLTKSAAMEYLDWGIRVNSVHPAQVADTGMISSATPAYRAANKKVMPMGRPARPDEIGQAVLFLASDDASYITANEIVVDGGAVTIALPRVRTILENEMTRR